MFIKIKKKLRPLKLIFTYYMENQGPSLQENENPVQYNNQ